MYKGSGSNDRFNRFWKRRGYVPVFFLLLAALFNAAAAKSLGSNYFGEKQKVRAPELSGAKSWLNTDKPLSLAGLKGKVVLLDFWTYGCVNCIHIIPDLKRLEAKYPNELVVIGVHSAKFENEKETDNIRNIILRYGIEHPVANDSEFAIWNAYAVNAWPTQVLIDPDGYIVGRVSGEGNYEVIDRAIAETVADFRKLGKLDESLLSFALERAKVGDLPLAFPGKVLADAKSDRLFISDSNHNRIVIAKLDGELVSTVGSGNVSSAAGDFASAGFNKPQGLALDGDSLYVADTGNHLIRKIDLKAGKVETVAGTGTLEGFNGFGGPALETALRSPWDVEFLNGYLYIAMAGSHQIWRLDPKKGYVGPYAGSRWEARKDGPVKLASFAQPSGLAAIGKDLFVADSESNIIREIDTEKGEVTTLAGGDLFDFGDKDGKGDDVRLQHPLGVEAFGGKILIADTYNHKIKVLEPEKRTVETFLGTGKEGQKDGRSASFYEPGGLSVAAGKLYIADTNNAAIRVADLKTLSVSTLPIRGLRPPDPGKQAEMFEGGPKADTFEAAPVSSVIGKSIPVSVNVDLPEGFHLNASAPQRVSIKPANEGIVAADKTSPLRKFPYEFGLSALAPGKTSVEIALTIYYCRIDNTGVCYIKKLKWNVPVVVTGAGPAARTLELRAAVREDP
jgi:thiol-disulfide isomerase/thioredoxin